MNPATHESRWISDRHLRLQVGEGDPLAAVGIWRVLSAARLPGVVEITPAYQTVTIAFDPLTLEPEEAAASVRHALEHAVPGKHSGGVTHEIPVCYQGEFAPDLDDVAALTDMPVERVIELHASAIYTVRFVGFSPGFPYLSGLDPALAVPRLDKPRVKVPAGSIAIAADQAGIYPRSTPGGWRLIGRTPAVLFDAARDPSSLLSPGDQIRFIPIEPSAMGAANVGKDPG